MVTCPHMVEAVIYKDIYYLKIEKLTGDTILT